MSKIEETTVLNENVAQIKEFLENVLAKMELNVCVSDAELSGETVFMNIEGEDAHHAIGYRGETLDALQYLCNLLLNTSASGFKRVTLDSENYRAKREKILQRLAGNIEQKVKRTGREVSLEPMNPYERRIIHTTLQSSKYVTTQSEGQGVNRHVVIAPVNQSNILNAPNAPRKTLNFVYRSEKKRRR